MNRRETLDRITEIFQNVFEDDTLIITEKTFPGDIKDWDSLAQITLISAIEDMFGIKFTPKDIPALRSVGCILDIIERKAAKAEPYAGQRFNEVEAMMEEEL